MERKQFTFYRSYYDAIKVLPQKEQTTVFLAICAYALEGVEPNLSGTASAIFTLIRPTLDSGKRKAENGKHGGNAKQTESKTQANRKQNESKTKAKEKQTASEIEKEKEKEKEIEKESYNPLPPFGENLQSAFDDWIKYKAERREGYKPTGLSNLRTQVQANAERYGEDSVADLIRTCMASGWRGIIFDRLAGAPKNGPTYTPPSPAQDAKTKRDVENMKNLLKRFNDEEVGA